MVRLSFAAAALAVVIGLATAMPLTGATASEARRCVAHHRHHVAIRHWPAAVVYGRADLRPAPAYNNEDNGQYDGADLPAPVGRRIAYGQPPSWLDGYGTRTAHVPGYGQTEVYAGSSQVWPRAITPAGGLAVYSAGAYGPGPRIIEIPTD